MTEKKAKRRTETLLIGVASSLIGAFLWAVFFGDPEHVELAWIPMAILAAPLPLLILVALVAGAALLYFLARILDLIADFLHGIVGVDDLDA